MHNTSCVVLGGKQSMEDIVAKAWIILASRTDSEILAIWDALQWGNDGTNNYNGLTFSEWCEYVNHCMDARGIKKERIS
jgi:hypothetical protein